MIFKNKTLKAITSIATTFCLAILTIFTPSVKIASAPEINNYFNTESTIDPEVNAEPNNIPKVEQAVSLIEEPILFTDIEYIELFDIELINNTLNEINNAISILNDAINTENFSESSISIMKNELERLESVYSDFQYDNNCYLKWEQEHYYATKVWQFLRARGYSNEVTCGIIGNMMIETSWLSLDLNPTLYDAGTGKYYGLCQWSKAYYPTIRGASFEEQLLFLEDTIQYEFKTFGKLHYKGFTYEAFKALDNPTEAALAFAKVYERCSSKTYDERQEAAMIAYKYFVK